MRCTTGRGHSRHTAACCPSGKRPHQRPALPYRCLDYILEEITRSRKASVMVASHNEDTVKFTLRRWVLGRKCGEAGTRGLRKVGAQQRCWEMCCGFSDSP